MVRRRETRVRTVLPVRVFGMDSSGKPFTELVHTLDVTNRGARIAGLQHSIKVGEIVGLQRGTDKARYRVAWVGEPLSRTAGQAGVECVQENKNIWNVVFEESPDNFDLSTLEGPAVEKPPSATLKGIPERRHHLRYTCDIGVEMQLEGSEVGIFARCTDISRGGCYIETRSPFPPDARVFISLKTHDCRIRALGVVRSSHPSLGMGVKFAELGEDDRLLLENVLRELDAGTKPPPTMGLVSRLQESVYALQQVKNLISSYPLEGDAAESLRMLIDVSLGALDTSRKSLQEVTAGPTLRDALRTHLVRSAVSITQLLERGVPPSSLDEGQFTALGTALEALLRKLSAVSPRAPFELRLVPRPPRTM